MCELFIGVVREVQTLKQDRETETMKLDECMNIND